MTLLEVRRKPNLGVAVLLSLVLLNGLSAYAVGQVPLQWIGNFLALGLGGSLLLLRRDALPGTAPLLLLMGWCAALNVISLISEDVIRSVPPLATTTYLEFVSLRYVTFLTFLVVAGFVYYLANRGQAANVVGGVTAIGVLLSLFALYVYLAYIYGLPEPPRSRMGTSGGEQAIRFTYQFHRAMGSFREPSHLAEWLISPFFLSLLRRGKAAAAATTAIALALVLTGSLTGILSVVFGFLLALVWLHRPRDLMRSAVKFVVPVALAVVLFSYIAVSYSDAAASLSGTLIQRLQPILESGSLKSSNRAAVYAYFDAHPPDWTGTGLGNSSLDLGAFLNLATVPSFLSLYWNTLYSAGYIGLALLAWFLLRPLFGIRRGVRQAGHSQLLLTAAYFAHLIALGVHTEELSFQFAILFGLFAAQRRHGAIAHVNHPALRRAA